MKQIYHFDFKLKELLSYTPLQYMLKTVEETPQLTNIYIDNENETNTCMIIFRHHLFVGGKATNQALEFLKEIVLTDEVRKDLEILLVSFPDDCWKDCIMNAFLKIEQYERSLYCSVLVQSMEKKVDNNITAITPKLMNSNIHNLSMLTDEIIGTGTYTNMEDFHSRGIGFTPIVDHRVCGFCVSEYPSQEEIAIGIEVLKEYQNQGIGKAMTKAFLHKAFKRYQKVNWECWKNNIASYQTAKSCGFELVADYPILFVPLI